METITKTTITETNPQKQQIKSVFKLAGLVGGIYIANKHNKGVWGFIGFGILGLITGSIAGSIVSGIVVKK